MDSNKQLATRDGGEKVRVIPVDRLITNTTEYHPNLGADLFVLLPPRPFLFCCLVVVMEV